jgi:hypothetical protein
MRHRAGSARHSIYSVVIVVSLFATACGASVPPLTNTQPSPSALAEAVLRGFERRDSTALQALAVSEQEFRDHIWPELPAARPERNLPFSYAWGDLRQKSEAALGATLASQGGHQYDLVRVRFLGGTARYKTYLIHRETALTVKDATGTELQLRLFGSTLEKDGQFKVFSFVVD